MPAATQQRRARRPYTRDFEQYRLSTCTITQHLPRALAATLYIGYEHGASAFDDPQQASALRARKDFPAHDEATHQRLMVNGGIIPAHWLPLLDARRKLLAMGIHGC